MQVHHERTTEQILCAWLEYQTAYLYKYTRGTNRVQIAYLIGFYILQAGFSQAAAALRACVDIYRSEEALTQHWPDCVCSASAWSSTPLFNLERTASNCKVILAKAASCTADPC